MNSGFENFKNLFNKGSNDPMQWDINQLKTEQKALQPIHEKYLKDKSLFNWFSKQLTNTTGNRGIEGGIDILDYKSRVKYGCKLLGYTEKQGCKP